MSVQTIKRGLVAPPTPPDAPQWFLQWLSGTHRKSLVHLDLLHSAIQAIPNLSVAAAAVFKAVVFPTPFKPVGYVAYTVMAMPNWNTPTMWVTAKTEKGCTLNFVAAPANATIDVLIVN